MNSFRRILSFILAILLMFVTPSIYFSLKQDILTQEVVEQETKKFVNTVSEQGRISEFSMNQFIKRLSCTNNLYDYDFVYKKLNQEPEYRFKTLDEILADQNAKYTGENVYTYREVKSEAPVVTNNEPHNLEMTKETNESVLANAVNKGTSVEHAHTKDCITGHLHEGEPFYYINHSHHDLGWSHGCHDYIMASKIKYHCKNCGKDGEELASYTYYSGDYPVYNNAKGIHIGNRYSATNCVHCGYTIYFSDMNFFYLWNWLCGFGIEEYMGWTYEFINKHGGYMGMLQDGYYDDFFVSAYSNGPMHDEKTRQYKIHDKAEKWCWAHRTENGCHYYHRRTLPPDYNYLTLLNEIEYAVYTDTWHYDMTNYRYYSEMIKAFETKNYCAVPTTYRFGIGGYDTKSYATYEVEKQGDGTFLFRLVDVYYYDRYDRGYDSYGNWRGYYERDYNDFPFVNLPQTMTVDEMAYAMSHWEETIRTYIPNASESWLNGYSYSDSIIRNASGTYFLCDDGTGTFLSDGWHTSCGQEENGTCQCGEIVKSIIPTHPTQSIYAGGKLITTLLITFLDGSTKTIVGNCNYDTKKLGLNQKVTITYDGIDANHQYKQFQTDITVSIVAKSKQCPNGHTYYLNEEGQDLGCPFCKAWVSSLKVINPSSGYLEITQGTTLESNGVTLLATYYDGHTETITSGYLNNLDNVYIGLQTVTIGYKGTYVNLQVRVNRRKKQCTICGREYELYPDGSDPGCPYCMALIPVFTGNVMKYYSMFMTEEILDVIGKDGFYEMNAGDELEVIVQNRNKTMASHLLSIFFRNQTIKIRVQVSNQIRDENTKGRYYK